MIVTGIAALLTSEKYCFFKAISLILHLCLRIHEMQQILIPVTVDFTGFTSLHTNHDGCVQMSIMDKLTCSLVFTFPPDITTV